MKKRSPFRQTSSNQDGFGIQRNAKRKPVRKKTKKKSVTKKQEGETTSPTPLSELSDQELVTFLASMPVVSQDNLDYLTTSGRLGNLFNTQFDNDDSVFGEQLQSAYNKYGSMVNQMDGGYKYQGEIADASERQVFNDMFYGQNFRPIEGTPYFREQPGTNYVEQVYGTGPDGIRGLSTEDNAPFSSEIQMNTFPGAPDASMYTGDQKGYIKALNEFRKNTLQEYADLFTDGTIFSQTSTSRLREHPGQQKFLGAASKLDDYIESEIELINQANQNVGNSGKNKRTGRNKRNKNRLFR